jgi:hypothetical protein
MFDQLERVDYILIGIIVLMFVLIGMKRNTKVNYDNQSEQIEKFDANSLKEEINAQQQLVQKFEKNIKGFTDQQKQHATFIEVNRDNMGANNPMILKNIKRIRTLEEILIKQREKMAETSDKVKELELQLKVIELQEANIQLSKQLVTTQKQAKDAHEDLAEAQIDDQA